MMKTFISLHRRVLRLVSHDNASKYLYGLSFAEAIVFPVPPDVMLIPMCAARPQDALRLGVLTTVFSVSGGVLGYALGFFLLSAVEPWLLTSDWAGEYQNARYLFEQWGVIIIVIAGFSPIPYKIFTFTAGALQLTFPLFVIASLIGRGGRFIMVAMLFSYLGTLVAGKVEKTVTQLVWLTVIVVVILLLSHYSGVM